MMIRNNIEEIRERIHNACIRAGRSVDEVALMAVSKFHPAEAIAEAYRAGQRLFGENRVQEAAAKFGSRAAIAEQWPGAEVHMIGNLQRNKASDAGHLFNLIQSIDRIPLIDELAKHIDNGTRLPVLFELNAGEESKSGFADEDALLAGVEKALETGRLEPRGLMIMAPWTGDDKLIAGAFRRLKVLQGRLEVRFPECSWECLSMGMSGDFETAIREGSTMVRIGTAIFGERR
jgi:pyridoxal phosphate enzyme (YggS family)